MHGPWPGLQVQFSLLDRRPLNSMVQLCQKHGIKLLTYGSVAGGLLSDRYVEEPRQGLFGGSCEQALQPGAHSTVRTALSMPD